jgi:enhancer of yellow 2 transcription factor|tara:strand:+ start:89 stop:391 length:303 start_codon:yes stop_codon:yes gene_type:complete
MSKTAPTGKGEGHQMSTLISQRLEESGERERLTALLRAKLDESGWRDELRAHCIEVIKRKGGVKRITMADLIDEVTPRARATVPAKTKEDLLARIETFLD